MVKRLVSVDDSYALPAPVGTRLRRGVRVFGFGDSHVEGSAQQGTPADWRTNKVNPVGASMYAWGVWLAKGAISVGNAGIGGQRTDEIHARVGEVTSSDADLCVLQMGTNDSRQGYPLSHTQEHYTGTVEKILAAGIDVIITGVPPCGGPPANDPAAVQDGQDRINAWLAEYAAQMRLPFVDLYTPLVNTANRQIATAYNLDGVHLNAAGVRIAGERIAAAIQQRTSPAPGWFTSSNIDATNLVAQALALGDANGDGVPDGWYAQGTLATGTEATHTLEAVTGWPGRALTIKQTGNANTRQVFYDRNISSGKFDYGDLMRAAVRVQTDGGVGALASIMFMDGSLGKGKVVIGQARAAVDDAWFVQEFRVPAGIGMTSLQFSLAAEPGTGTVRFGQPTLVNLTRLGIA